MISVDDKPMKFVRHLYGQPLLISEASWLPGTASPSRTVQTAAAVKGLPLPLKVTFVVTRQPALTCLAEIGPCLSLQLTALARRIDFTVAIACACVASEGAARTVATVIAGQTRMALTSRHVSVWPTTSEILLSTDRDSKRFLSLLDTLQFSSAGFANWSCRLLGFNAQK